MQSAKCKMQTQRVDKADLIFVATQHINFTLFILHFTLKKAQITEPFFKAYKLPI